MVKSLIRRALPAERTFRRIRGGLCRGLLMQLDLQSQLQRFVGLDEREICEVVRIRSSNAPTLIDIGANDGYYTLAFLNSPAAHVVACEPGPAAEQLLKNAAANGHQLSDRFRLERRLIGRDAGNITLADLLTNLPTPVFIKLDVDGGEVGVLESSQSYPTLEKVTWVVETHSVALENNCIEWFAAHGYRTQVVSPAWWRRWIPEQRPLEHNQWLVAYPLS